MQHKHALLLAVLAPLAVWACLLPAYLAGGNGLSADSASYIECAESIRAGRGFQVRPFGGLDRRLWQPLDYFPPGYPLLTAGLMELGVGHAYGAARAVAAGCSCLFLLLVLGFYARTLPLWIAALLGIGLVSTPPMLACESACLSEGPYMLLTAASLLLLLRGTAAEKRDSPHLCEAPSGPFRQMGTVPFFRRGASWWLFAAGLAGGCAWCVRNVGAALFLASLLYLGSQLPRLRAGGLARAAGAWLAGWFAGCGWLVAWNLRTFGAISPYHMPPRELPIALMAMIAAAAVATAIVILSAAKNLFRAHARSFAALRMTAPVYLLGGFLLFHVLAVIMAHSVYRMGEAVQSFRFYVAVYWIGLWLVALYVRRLSARLPLKPRRTAAMLVAAAAVLAASQAVGVLLAAKRDAPGRDEVARLGKRIPKDKLVLADRVEELRVFGEVNARCVPDVKYGQAPLTWSEIGQAGRDGRLWGIVLWNDGLCRQGRFGDALRELVLSPGMFPQLRKLETGSRMSVWEFVPERTPHAPREETASRGA